MKRPAATPAGIYLAVGLGAAGLYLALPPAIQPWGYPAFAAAAVAPTMLRARSECLRRRAWVLLGISYGLMGLGDVLYQLAGDDVAFPSVADVAYVWAYLPASVGAFLIARRTGAKDFALTIETLAVTIAAGLLIWVLWVDELALSLGVSSAQQLLALSYPVFDLVIISFIVGRAGALSTPAARALVAGWSLFLIGDVWYARAALEGTYEVGVVGDALWLAGYVCFGAAALAVAVPTRDPGRRGLLRRAALSAALLTAPTALILQTTVGTHVDVVEIGVAELLLSSLVLGRLLLSQHDLTRALRNRESAFERERARALAGGRLLDANDADAVEGIALEALWQLVPDELSPRVLCWRAAGHSATAAKALGEGAEKLVGSSVPILDVTRYLIEDRATAPGCATTEPVYVKGDLRMVFSVDATATLDKETRDAAHAVAIDVELALSRLALTSELLTSEANFRRLADGSRDVVFRYRAQHPRGFDYISPSIESFTGCTPGEHYKDAAIAERYVHPDDWPRAAAIYYGRIVEATSMNVRFIRPDGGIVETEHVLTPVYDHKGRMIAIDGIARDLTTQHAALADLSARETILREVFARTSMGMAIIDSDTCEIAETNDAFSEMSGYDISELIGMRLESIVGDPDDQDLASLACEVLEGEGSVSTERAYLRKDGEHRWAHLGLSRLDGSDTSAKVLAQLLDITTEHSAIERLAESEALFRAAFDEAGVAMAVGTGIDRPLERVNKKLCELTGFTPKELLDGGPLLSLFAPDQPVAEAAVAALSWEGSPSADIRFTTKAGELRWARVTLSLVDRGGADALIVAQIVDVTREKEATATAEQSEALFHSMFDDSDIPMALTDTVPRFIQVNDALCRMLGYERLELLSLDPLGLAHPDDFEAMMADQAAKADVPSLRQQQRYRRKDGSVVWAEVVVLPVRDATGEIVSYLGQMRDLTPQRHASEELKELQRTSELILSHAGEGVIGIDRDGATTFVNPAAARMLGWRAEELLGRELHGVIHHSRPDGSPYSPEECPVLRLVLEGGPTLKREDEVYWRKDGTSFPVSYVATAISEEDENLGAVVIFQDVTARSRLEDQLQQAQKMEALGAVAGGVAHDFNNLLFVVRTAAQFLLDSSALDEEARQDAGDIAAAADRGASLVRHLLTFSRKQVGQPVVLDLNKTIEEIEKIVGRVISANIELHVESGTALWLTKIDPVQAEQILMNLVVNARDAMPDGGRLVIRTANVRVDEILGELHGLEPGPYVTLIVRDTGVGIPGSVKSRIFEPFFTTKAREKGTGLGLSTVYGIVKKANGTIVVESTVGVGTSFQIYLPALSTASVEVDEGASAVAVRGRGQKILVVEDDPGVRSLVERNLRDGGYSPLVAEDATEALEFFANNPDICLVLTDVVMPGMSGFSLAQELAHQDDGLPILYMSGYADQLPTEEAIEASEFLQKPFSREEMLAKIAAKLASSRAGDRRDPPKA